MCSIISSVSGINNRKQAAFVVFSNQVGFQTQNLLTPSIQKSVLSLSLKLSRQDIVYTVHYTVVQFVMGVRVTVNLSR